MSDEEKFHGKRSEVKIKDLRLDNENPRLADKYRGARQADIADALRMGYNLLPIAKSMVANGYFNSEPLLVIENPEEDGTWVVVEGNRRTACLKGLTDPEILQTYDDAKFDDLANESMLSGEDLVPVVVHKNRRAAQVEVGRTHIIGKLDWQPFAQARYISKLISSESMSFEEVGDELGIPKSNVSKTYRDLAVADQAVALGAITAPRLETAYSLVTVAMGITSLRSYVGAPQGNHVNVDEPPVSEDKEDELTEMIGWIFGTSDREPVIQESRELSKLGKVVNSEVGLAAIREGKTLTEANELVSSAGLDPLDRLTRRLRTAIGAMTDASEDLTEYVDDADIKGLVETVKEKADDLQSTVDTVDTVDELGA